MPRRSWWLAWRPYLAVTVAVVLATLVRLPFEALLLGRAPYALFFLVVLGAAWYFGPGAAGLATVLSLLLSWYVFVPVRYSVLDKEAGHWPPLILFALVAAAMVLLARGTRRHAALALTAARAEELERSQVVEGQARLAAIVESSDDAIISKNLQGVIQSWNAGAQRILGYREEEIVGQSILRLIPPDRQDEETAILNKLRRGERVDHFETMRLAKDGRLVELSITVSPIKNAAGIVVGASKVARDITERRRIERALAHQREWFRVTLASIGDGVITADRDARVSFMNAVAEELTGWSAAEAEGRPLADVFRIEAEDGGPVLDPFGEVMRTREVVALANHTCLVARDGSRRSIADSAAPIIGADQQVIGVVLVFHDVSERRRLEQERQAAAAEREHLLESERVARGEAERASRLKDDFVATLSHELRTPLTAILGWAQILKRKASDADTVARGIAVIERNTRLQTQLISDLLDMSRIVSGKLRLEIQPSDLATVVDGVADTVRPAAEAKGIHIERMIQRGAKPVPVDAARLQQVIWNLLSNAIKFTPDGGQVAVRFTQDATHAEIAVDDSGIGIRDEFLPHLFGRFRQADASTSRRFGGLGLGLAIVKELVELHGGSVSASSAGEGLGARFVVRLPVRPRVPSVATLAEAVPDVPPASLTVLAGLRVLLVEDDGDTRELLGQLLRDAGLAVRAVSSAGEALESLASDPPDVIVSDISMPGEDGYTFMQRVRALEGQLGAVVPAIALTAFARDEDRSRAIRAGFQAHLAKPVDSAALLAVIGAVARVVPDAPVQ